MGTEIYGVSLEVVCMAVVVFFTAFGWLVPLGVKIGYGRLKNSFVKFEVEPRLAWFLFEVPNLIWAFYFLIIRQDKLTLGYGLFILHYINRDIIYPLRLKTKNKVPLQIILSAGLFTTANGYLQALSNQSLQSSPQPLILTLLGTIIFFTGMYINIKSDQILQSARKQSPNKKQQDQPQPESKQNKNKHGYVAINQFLFKYVANPNYFGEIVEWFGYFLVCGNLNAFLFFFSTINILVAAALPRSKWNKQNIEGYPKERKAVFPFIL